MGRTYNQPTGGNDACSIGAAAVQQIKAYGTELYLRYRYFELDGDIEADVHPVNLGTVGARVKF